MPEKEEKKERKRIVVEEVGETPNSPQPEILDEAAKDVVPETSESKTEKLETQVMPEEVKTPQEIKPKKSVPVALWIIIPGIFLLGAILGGIVFYQRGVNKGEEINPSSTIKPAASAIPSPSPEAIIDLTKYKIHIFNGSGIVGEAGKAEKLLTSEGFIVGSLGNAASYNYTKTIIKTKSSVEKSYISTLLSALGKSYVVDTVQTLASSSADAVQVIIGSSKAD